MFGHKKEKKTDRPAAAPGGDKLGVYIHIPFCKSKCDYCDFYSLAGREDQMDRYQDPEKLADSAIHFALLSYAAGAASRRYVTMLRRRQEAPVKAAPEPLRRGAHGCPSRLPFGMTRRSFRHVRPRSVACMRRLPS